MLFCCAIVVWQERTGIIKRAMELNVDEPKRSHEERTSSLHIESRAEERDS